jgi:hypothetical protein
MENTRSVNRPHSGRDAVQDEQGGFDGSQGTIQFRPRYRLSRDRILRPLGRCLTNFFNDAKRKSRCK